MKQILVKLTLLTVLLALSACGGVPLRSLPRLMSLQSELLVANPAEFMVALQVDARLVPPAGAVPLLIVKLLPVQAGAFEPIDKKLPLQLSVTSVSTLGLEPPPAGRRWLIYSLPAPTQAELRRVQNTIQQAKALPNGQGAGSLSVGVEQDSLAVTEPTLASTRWDTWLQTRKQDGFYEVWSGTPEQIRKLAAGRK